MKWVTGKEFECSICLENVTKDKIRAELPCGHEFSGKCIEKWYQTSSTCPICRANFKFKKHIEIPQAEVGLNDPLQFPALIDLSKSASQNSQMANTAFKVNNLAMGIFQHINNQPNQSFYSRNNSIDIEAMD